MLFPALLGSLLLGPPAEPSATSDETPTVVLLVPERPGDLDERALATVAAHLQDLDLSLVTERYTQELDLRRLLEDSRAPLERSDAVGLLWVDIHDGAGGPALALYVVARDGSEIYGRPVADTLEQAAAIETLANVAATAATALSEGRVVQLDLPDVGVVEPEPEPEPAPEPIPELVVGTITRAGEVDLVERPWLRLRAGYRGNTYADALPWQSSVSFAIGVRPDAVAHVELVGDVAIPATVSTDALDLTVRRYALGLAASHAWTLRRGWELELGGRLVAEPTHRAALARLSTVTTRPDAWRWTGSVGIDVTAGVRLAEAVRLSLGAGTAAVLVRRDLVIDLASGPGIVLSPHPVRLFVWAGFDFDLVWR